MKNKIEEQIKQAKEQLPLFTGGIDPKELVLRKGSIYVYTYNHAYDIYLDGKKIVVVGYNNNKYTHNAKDIDSIIIQPYYTHEK